MSRAEHQRRILRAAWVPFLLGAVLVLVELLQQFTDRHWLDSPWSGAVGMWLLALVMTTLGRRPLPPA